MKVPNHSSTKVAAYLRMLKRADAPGALIVDFQEIVEIDNSIAEGTCDLESLDRLLLDVCRRHGFPRPFDKPQARAWLRPSTIGSDHPDRHADTDWGKGDEQFDPVVEQAYRRGYDQGFNEARRLAEKNGIKALPHRESQIHKWRRAPIYFNSSLPGSSEAWGVKVSIRSSLPAKRRFDVLERDKFRCIRCGRSAADGIVLHVDHKVAVCNGGLDEMENLQTLCEECNLGKGAR